MVIIFSDDRIQDFVDRVCGATDPTAARFPDRLPRLHDWERRLLVDAGRSRLKPFSYDDLEGGSPGPTWQPQWTPLRLAADSAFLRRRSQETGEWMSAALKV